MSTVTIDALDAIEVAEILEELLRFGLAEYIDSFEEAAGSTPPV